MSPAHLLEHFDRLINTPDAIPRLRRFILDLAVRGKLVEQDPKDEPAGELLRALLEERERLISSGVVKSGVPTPTIGDDELPFTLPNGWALVRLGDALQLFNGRPFKPSEWSKSGRPIVRIQNLNDLTASFNYCSFAVPEKYCIKTGDFLISWSGTPGTSFGAHIWERGPAVLNQHIFKALLIGGAFIPLFLRLAINSRLLELIEQAHGGVGLQHITKPKLERLPLTLPPLAEQHRIVAKVDELMALCDELEAAQTKCEKRRDRLVSATLHGLNNGDTTLTPGTPATFKEDARFYFNHLPRLTTRPGHIHQLRQTILNLAVCGNLVSQDKRDELVGVLIERVAVEQRRAIAENRFTKRVLTGSLRFQPDYEIPEGWRWLRLAELITFGPQNGTSPKPTTNENAPKALTLTATTSGFFNPAYYKHVALREDECENYWLVEGDVLFQRGNTREYVGMAAVYTGSIRSFVFPDLMIRVRFAEELDLRFLHTCLISPLLRSYFSSEASGASSTMPKISQSVILNAPIPLPPRAEQHRIVAKVDELMALCDEMEAGLDTVASTKRRLLEVNLLEALPA